MCKIFFREYREGLIELYRGEEVMGLNENKDRELKSTMESYKIMSPNKYK